MTNKQISINSPLPSNQSVEMIKFFGHSLSSADYAYFQSVFDYYDIYSNYVHIVFYYMEYEDESENFIQTMLANRVTALINWYGTQMTENNKGKNLLHKLLLEHRLKLIKLPTNTIYTD